MLAVLCTANLSCSTPGLVSTGTINADRYFISECNQSSWSTQPRHPSTDWQMSTHHMTHQSCVFGHPAQLVFGGELQKWRLMPHYRPMQQATWVYNAALISISPRTLINTAYNKNVSKANNSRMLLLYSITYHYDLISLLSSCDANQKYSCTHR